MPSLQSNDDGMFVGGWHGARAPTLPAALREDSVGWHHDRTRARLETIAQTDGLLALRLELI